MPLTSCAVPVECFLIHDGVPLPKTTFRSELIRLRREAVEAQPPDLGYIRDRKYLDRRCRGMIEIMYGRMCWDCGKEITIVYDIEPQLRKPDGADSPQWLHAACWRRLQKKATNKRRRNTYAAKRDAQLALPPPPPMLALQAPPDDEDIPVVQPCEEEPAV